jgi:ornithine cyclodeaminase/alanine dehydrogenase
MESPPILYLSRADVEHVALDMPAIIALLETAFRENAEGRVDMPPKPSLYPGGDAFLNAMPAYIGGMAAAGIKWVGGSPGNAARGLPYITGLIILNDPVTLLPCAVMDCTWITARRTAAASALSAKHLARPESETLGILGCGAQGRSHLEALLAAFPLRRVQAFDVAADIQRRFGEEMGEKTGIKIVGVDTPRKAMTGCDIVVTAGPLLKHPRPTADAGWLEPGAFASAVDYDAYWTAAALAEMDKVATDDLPQWRHMRKAGYFQQMAEPYADLGEIVTGRKPGREGDGERILAMNLGLALDDMAVAVEVYRRARALGIGVELPL